MTSMQPVYQKALEQIGVDKEEIETFLDTWRTSSARGIRIVDNIRNDYHIQVKDMKEILIELFKNKSRSIVDIENEIYRKKCYASGLGGSPIDKTKLPELFGCAKTEIDFKASLKERYKSLSDDQIDTLVDKLYSTTAVLSSAEEEIPLSPFAWWSTWGHDDSSPPFHYLPIPGAKVVHVLANMGLSHTQLGFVHLLFVYSKSAVGELRIPTIADAALYSYFKCTSADEKCGWTQPWNPEDYQRHGVADKDVKPRPEGVHVSIKLKDLKRPLQQIRP